MSEKTVCYSNEEKENNPTIVGLYPNLLQDGPGLQRKLLNRHIQLIAIGISVSTKWCKADGLVHGF
jgi:amino acid permease